MIDFIAANHVNDQTGIVDMEDEDDIEVEMEAMVYDDDDEW